MTPRLRNLPIISYLAVAALLVTGCGATPIDTVPASLLGTWQAEATVRAPISFAPPPKDMPRQVDETIELNIIIHEDASVSGTVGGAELKECVLKNNRSELGRQLNIASDYIVIDGYLDGPIIPGDTELHKDFTIPFDVVDGHMQGSVMWLQDWKYPSPLMEVDLDRDDG